MHARYPEMNTQPGNRPQKASLFDILTLPTKSINRFFSSEVKIIGPPTPVSTAESSTIAKPDTPIKVEKKMNSLPTSSQSILTSTNSSVTNSSTAVISTTSTAVISTTSTAITDISEKPSQPSLPVVNITKPPTPPPPPEKAEKTASITTDNGNHGDAPMHHVRTFRIWHPSSGRKSVLVNIGKEVENDAESQKVFQTSNIKQKGYLDWRKEAKAQLPSVTGGSAIENIEDVVQAAPMVQKETNPRVMQMTLKRLSTDSQGKAPVATPANGITARSSTNNRPTWRESAASIIVIESEEEDDREDDERHQAGLDIKGKIRTLKELTENLASKRIIRQQLVQKATGSTLLDTEEIPVKEQALYVAEYLHQFFHDCYKYMVIWQTDIALINGRFGVVVASYFIWLRRILCLNFIYFITALFVVIIPQINEQSGEPDPHPNVIQESFKFSDFIHGAGSFHHSYLYYSGYHNRNENSDNPFDNPAFRFIFAIFLIFVTNTYFIFSRINIYYHSVRMESRVSGVAKMDNFKSIICAWDFSCDDPEASQYLHKTIRRELVTLVLGTKEGGKNKLELEIEAEHKAILAYCVQKFGMEWGPFVMHAISNLLLLICCFVLGTVLYVLCQFKLDYYLNCISERDNGIRANIPFSSMCPGGDLYLKTWILSLPALFTSITWLVLTKLIILVGESENWETAENKILAAMIRAGIFDLTNIAVFYSFWISSKNRIVSEGFVAETIFGEELYRLIVIQGILDVTLNLGVKGLYHIFRRHSKHYKLSEFRSENCAMSMIFVHSISTIGLIFCPPISFFVMIRIITDFYQQKLTLLHLSSHDTYESHASSVYGPYLLTYFVSYLLTSSLNVYYLSQTKPSQFDGPFIRYNISYDEVISNFVTQGSGINSLRNLAQPGFLYTNIMIIGALVYFCREWALAYEPIIQQLNDLILLERGDRDLLLKAIFQIGVTTDEPSVTTAKKHTLDEKILAENSVAGEDERKVEDQINQLIKHVQGRRSLDTRNTMPASETGQIWSTNTGRHHRDHMAMIVANIVQERDQRDSLVSTQSVVSKKSTKKDSNDTSYSGMAKTKISKFEKTKKN